ncbi:FAD-binding domain-containing protein [Multifurca ochricompacta]|uniref:FAD-binding domain-containing protein n=1 Tax=Multifurca ochricompacta TaxID=376703 RepID=A0AAD4QGI9_9AGAM|nr:FAD-binding domain-containing protein [Multifurca ochricompacta]
MLRAAFWRYTLILPIFLAAIVRAQYNIQLGYPASRQVPTSSLNNYTYVCNEIENSISHASQVFYPGSPEFGADISHWANSSSQVSACSVEPGTLADVGQILHLLASTHTPFAVKCGGHSVNLGFSSTPGVHISLIRFNNIVVHEDSGTVDVGAGLTWTDVYTELIPKGINVVGGRLNGVGVSGVTLGGGYSWKTNQYGLTIDTVTQYELVLPNGDVKVVTNADDDLWFALKGGFNNYGIVTKFTFQSHQQTNIWAALLNFAEDQMEAAQSALAQFLSEDRDRKAAQLAEFVYTNGSLSFGISLFYDGSAPPEGFYDDILNLPSASKSITTGSFTDFVLSQFLPTYKRVYFDAVPMLDYTVPIMTAFANETKFWGESLSKVDESVLVVYSLDPFASDFLTHGGPSAYPPDRSLPVKPSSIFYGWTDPSVDNDMRKAMRTSAATLVSIGIEDGQTDLEHAAPYINYALFGTPLEKMYGGNLERLREIRRTYDPENIMGLAGGWKF